MAQCVILLYCTKLTMPKDAKTDYCANCACWQMIIQDPRSITWMLDGSGSAYCTYAPYVLLHHYERLQTTLTYLSVTILT